MGQVHFVGGNVLFVKGKVCMAGYPCCQKANCDTCSYTGHKTLGVDLKDGGWTKVWCDTCTDIKGEYLLSETSHCAWYYQEDDFCVYWAGGQENRFDLVVSARIEDDRFKARVMLAVGLYLADGADYQSDPINNSNCFGNFVDGRLSLTKVTEVHIAPLCQGSMPETIELFEA